MKGETKSLIGDTTTNIMDKAKDQVDKAKDQVDKAKDQLKNLSLDQLKEEAKKYELKNTEQSSKEDLLKMLDEAKAKANNVKEQIKNKVKLSKDDLENNMEKFKKLDKKDKLNKVKELANKKCSEHQDRCQKISEKMLGMEGMSEKKKEEMEKKPIVPEECKTDLTCEDASKNLDWVKKCATYAFARHSKGIEFDLNADQTATTALRFLEDGLKIIKTSDDPTANDTSLNELEVTDNDVTVDGSTPSKANTSTADDYVEEDNNKDNTIDAKFYAFTGIIALIALLLF
jgi:chromosome segregation ATPase